MRRLCIGATTLVGALLVLAPVAGAGTTNPCALITAKDAAKALGATPAQPKAKTVAGVRQCTYAVKGKSLVVQTQTAATKAAFAKIAKATPGPTLPVPQVGDGAYSAANGQIFLAWDKGVEVTLHFVGVTPFVATQQDLAKTAVGRL